MKRIPITITCLYCNKDFTTSPSYAKKGKKYCSDECYRAYQREHHTVQKTCIICGITFTQQKARAQEQVTCRSEECMKAMWSTPEYNPNYGKRESVHVFTCLHCGKTVETFESLTGRKFCNADCYNAYHRIEKTCAICGAIFTQGKYRGNEQVTCRSDACKREIYRRRMIGYRLPDESIEKMRKTKTTPRTEIVCTCGCGEKLQVPRWRIKNNKTGTFFVNPTHLQQWLVGENHWNYRGGNIYYGDGWVRVARAVRERDKVCQYCGKTPKENGRALDVHHINPARISQDNSMENLIALCMSCHHGINALEQYQYPLKVNKYRVCLVCKKAFIPEPFQKICSDECRRIRTREYEKKYQDTHPEYVKRKRQRIKHWQQTNPEKMAEYRRHRPSRSKRQLDSESA